MYNDFNMVDIKKICMGDTCFEERCIPHENLAEVVDELKKKNKRIVLTQGVFDLIHEGHALYLEKAKQQGDVLIVGVDSDDLTKKRKGPSRPIVPQSERLKMLVHLRHVDIVTVREVHHGIGDLVHLVKPNVFVTSQSTKDFTDGMKKEYEGVCGEVLNFPPQGITSTSARIRTLTIEGATQLSEEIKKLTDSFIEKIRGAN